MRRMALAILAALTVAGCGGGMAGSVSGPVPKSHLIGFEHIVVIGPFENMGGMEYVMYYRGGY